MVALPGSAKQAGPRTFFMESRLLTQIMEQLSGRLAQFSGQQMADRTGLVRRVGTRASCGAYHLLMQRMKQPLAAMERLCEQLVEEARVLPRQVGRLARL